MDSDIIQLGKDQPWSILVEGSKERYRPHGNLTLELVLKNQKQNKLLKNGPTLASFHLLSGFSNKHYNFYNK